MTLHGKRVLLTGGTTGIGRALLIKLAAEGARVLTFGRDADALDEALAAAGGETSGIVADIGRANEVERIFREVDHRLGGIDVLVSNAALGAEPIDEMADADWRYVLDVNLAGAMGCARAALERFDGGGQIVIVGSISSVIHAPGESVYSATKAGLAAFAETLRKETAERGVRVSLIEPGTTGSDMQAAEADEQREQIAAHEMLDADDIAEAIHFVLTRPERVDVVTLRIEPRIQALS
ncbi:oxidoreductase [Sphingomonas spermidinifaciens]|uniref:Oxidoreductase n=1 Tax=Sphingomonas spermidinifaciens TaxID=1141889 RepID=A0A2A4B3C1_9SPHN|nr:SDR family oxidoreductase [Sphingomonas spermidinifaciens]PCD02136.1 oxidoreductase [Sphingomonas spermidinifaciens]